MTAPASCPCSTIEKRSHAMPGMCGTGSTTIVHTPGTTSGANIASGASYTSRLIEADASSRRSSAVYDSWKIQKTMVSIASKLPSVVKESPPPTPSSARAT